jgi:hypothetical protein
MLQVYRNVLVRRVICLYDYWNIVVWLWFLYFISPPCFDVRFTRHVLSRVTRFRNHKTTWSVGLVAAPGRELG